MLKASACLAADDVAIPCRIRHSPYATNKEFNESEDMICTMRIWHKTCTPDKNALTKPASVTKSRSYGSPGGPFDRSKKSQEAELVLTSIHNPVLVQGCNSAEIRDPIRMSKRFESFGSSDARVVPKQRPSIQQRQRNCNQQPQQPQAGKRRLGNVTIPISDIMVVDMYGQGESHCTNITTMSSGFFEFTMENRNGQEVLLAFLKASLPKERVMDGPIPRSPSELSENTHGTFQSFDVEAFTASRMAERMERESFSEKIRRKVGRVISSIEEVTSSLTDCSCGCGTAAVSPAPAPVEKRDSPPRSCQHDFDEVEIASNPTPERLLRPKAAVSKLPITAKGRSEMLSGCHMPSGLSVEDAEMEPAY